MPLDPQVKSMLEQMQALNLPPLQTLPIADARAAALASIKSEAPQIEVGDTEDLTIPNPAGAIPIRIYHPQGTGPFPILMFFHGGGFVLGNLDTHDHICRALCRGSDHIVISVDYRLAPEHKFPVAVDECLAATRWAHLHARQLNGLADRIAVAGDSCGGNLAAVIALRCRDEAGPLLCGQLLIYPITDYYDPPTPSYISNADGYFLTRDIMIWFMDHYMNDQGEADNPWLAPLRSSDLSGLPPALMIVAEYDPLRDEGIAYYEKLRAAGVDAGLSRYDGMIHGFYGNIGVLKQADSAVAESCQWLRAVVRNEYNS